ncbi:winged helix-turn-helix transcriptional regulator, partial [Legionella pneumophila]
MKNKPTKNYPNEKNTEYPIEILDKIDRKILNILQKNNQITNQALA